MKAHAGEEKKKKISIVRQIERERRERERERKSKREHNQREMKASKSGRRFSLANIFFRRRLRRRRRGMTTTTSLRKCCASLRYIKVRLPQKFALKVKRSNRSRSGIKMRLNEIFFFFRLRQFFCKRLP